MNSFRRLLVIGGIAIGAVAAPASATVLMTGPLFANDISVGTYHACVAVNTSTKPLSSTSKVELLDSGGAVLNSASLSGLPPGTTAEITDGSFYFETCRFTVSGAKTIKGMIAVYYYDGTKYLTLSQDDAR